MLLVNRWSTGTANAQTPATAHELQRDVKLHSIAIGIVSCLLAPDSRPSRHPRTVGQPGSPGLLRGDCHLLTRDNPFHLVARVGYEAAWGNRGRDVEVVELAFDARGMALMPVQASGT